MIAKTLCLEWFTVQQETIATNFPNLNDLKQCAIIISHIIMGLLEWYTGVAQLIIAF